MNKVWFTLLRNHTIIFIFVLLSKLVGQSTSFFIEENGKAIRDSVEMLKYVNPDKTIKFIYEILEKYPEKRPNQTFLSSSGSASVTLSSRLTALSTPRR